jgi:hypothetical protein
MELAITGRAGFTADNPATDDIGSNLTIVHWSAAIDRFFGSHRRLTVHVCQVLPPYQS